MTEITIAQNLIETFPQFELTTDENPGSKAGYEYLKVIKSNDGDVNLAVGDGKAGHISITVNYHGTIHTVIYAQPELNDQLNTWPTISAYLNQKV